MSTRRKIDKLYLSKFEGAEIAPPQEAWQNIASRLPAREQEKRMLPLWIRYAGTAAVLLLLVSLGMNFFTTGHTSPVAGTPVSRQDIHREIRLSSQEFTETMLKISMTLQEIMRGNEASAAVASGEMITKADTPTLASGEAADRAAGKGSEGLSGMVNQVPGPGATGSSAEERAILAENSDTSSEAKTEEDAIIAIAGNADRGPGEQEGLTADEISEENAIARRLSEEYATAEEEEVAAGGKISISTRVAPVFYENRGNRNVMIASMAGGEPSGEVSLSYGVNVAYQVSQRIKLRTGLNKLDLSFSTPGVPMAVAIRTGSLPGENDPFLMTRLPEGDLQHRLDFIEVPVEVEYRLLDSRLGLNLIAGGSSLFLNSNDLSMDTGVRTADLGQVENLEKLSFSANIGVGLDYELSPALRLNLEPMFKYQLNDDNGIRPLYMAIYSGFSYSF